MNPSPLDDNSIESLAAKQNIDSFGLVVVGSSAGGVKALSIFVSTLPADFAAPIVLAQHLDPNYPSNLGEILQRRTSLIVDIVSSSSKLEPGHIYVVPANQHVVISDNSVELQGDHLSRPRPSVDLLLSTAASYYGEHLVAVILTGSGSDGAAGAVDVKNAGGVVIVQNPATALFPSMPAALPRSIIDFEVDLEQIGPLLNDLLTRTNINQVVDKSEDIVRSILEKVNRQASIDFRPYKTKTILRRISRRMVITGNRSFQSYLEYLDAHPKEVGELVAAFLINVTQFFRDAEAFEYLKSEIIPALIEKARSKDRVLRFWSAGCSTGEEPYSLAMIVADLLGSELSAWSVKIFATDLDAESVNVARRGIYLENLIKNVPENYRSRFFEQVEQGYLISRMLRQMVIFGQQDLSRSAPFPRIDLITCRNVLIYFTPELQDYILNQFVFSLFSNNGYLFLGKAEIVRPNLTNYEHLNKQWKFFRCVGNSLALNTRQSYSEQHSVVVDKRNHSRSIVYANSNSVQVTESNKSSSDIEQLRRFNELLLRYLPVGVAVIDRTYRLLTVNNSARHMLGLKDSGNELDFLHAVRGIPYTLVRNAIDNVFRDRNTVTLSEVELPSNVGGNGRYLSISIALMQMDPGLPDLAAISINDVTSQIQVRQELEKSQLEQNKLLDGLNISNRRLSELNKEVMDANEELQVANEELVLTHEELQATIEEFETTNEELQATNEELETNNEELHSTNEELQTTNEELRARTNELQQVAELVETERIRLFEVVKEAPFYIMILKGQDLVVETFNPVFSEILDGVLLRGRPLGQILDFDSKDNPELLNLSKEVFQKDKFLTLPNFERSIKNADNSKPKKFELKLVASHNSEGKVSGVIIYAREVND